MADLQKDLEKALARKEQAEKKKPVKSKPKILPKQKVEATSYLPALLIMLGLAIIYFLLKLLKNRTDNVQGAEGEYWVRKELEKLDPSEYHVVNNIYLPTRGDVSQTEIDHVVISNYGVFCIETKAIRGMVYGNGRDKQWVRFIKSQPFFFMNPCRQNYKHVQTLKEYIKKRNVFSIIVFTHATEVKVANTSEVVVGVENLIKRIMSFEKKIFINKEKEEIYNLLLRQNIDSNYTRSLHRKQVKRKKYQQFHGQYFE